MLRIASSTRLLGRHAPQCSHSMAQPLRPVQQQPFPPPCQPEILLPICGPSRRPLLPPSHISAAAALTVPLRLPAAPSSPQNEADAYRNIKLRVEDVQGRNCLTQFYVSASSARLPAQLGAVSASSRRPAWFQRLLPKQAAQC